MICFCFYLYIRRNCLLSKKTFSKNKLGWLKKSSFCQLLWTASWGITSFIVEKCKHLTGKPGRQETSVELQNVLSETLSPELNFFFVKKKKRKNSAPIVKVLISLPWNMLTSMTLFNSGNIVFLKHFKTSLTHAVPCTQQIWTFQATTHLFYGMWFFVKKEQSKPYI